MSTQDTQATQAGQQIGHDIEVMLGESFTIDVSVPATGQATIDEFDPEFVQVERAAYTGPFPEQETDASGKLGVRFKTLRQGRTVVQGTLTPNPLAHVVVLLRYNVTIIGF